MKDVLLLLMLSIIVGVVNAVVLVSFRRKLSDIRKSVEGPLIVGPGRKAARQPQAAEGQKP